MKKYQKYQAIDFAKDERFQSWVLSDHSAYYSFWNSFLQQYPDKQSEITKARNMVLMLGRPHQPVDSVTHDRIKQGIYQQIRQQPTSDLPHSTRHFKWYWAAASILFFVAVSIIVTSQLFQNETLSTGYGEKQFVVLPDGSEVTLKANSSLQFVKKWEEGEDREVWLRGEAFFHVNRQKAHNDKVATESRSYTSFVVHAGEGIDVNVLGTEFNVSSRDQTAEVALKSGQVRLNFQQNQQERTLLMKPGDFVEIQPDNHRIVRQQIDVKAASAWRENMLVFDAITLVEVAKKLHHTYGVNIVINNKQLAKREFKGFVPSDNLKVALETFQSLYGIEIKHQENQIIFSQPSTNDIE